MRFLSVLTVGLLMVFMPSLRAQSVMYDSWIAVSDADGSWEAGGDTIWSGDPGCELCSTDASVSVSIYEYGVGLVAQVSADDPNGNASADYFSQTIVDLKTTYEVDSIHGWDDGGGASSSVSMDIPGIPSISLRGVDASSPPFAQWSFTTYPNGSQSLYSSTLDIGGLTAISYSTENPTFTFDQSQYPGLIDEPVTIPVTFQGYLAGHFFGGPTTNVTVWLGKTVTDYTTSNISESTEITGGVPTELSTTHTATENFDLYTYPPFLLFTSLPEYVVHMNTANATIDTHNNICTPAGPAECDIFLIGEVNRWPFPPYPAINNDPMTPVPIGIYPGGTDSKNLWALQANYYGIWLQEGTGFAVCNTLFQIYAYSGGTPDLSPMGCIGLTLP